MSKTNKNINAQINYSSKNGGKVIKESMTLNNSLEKNTKLQRDSSKAINEKTRNLRGAAQATGAASRDFSRMSQGLGGIVSIYATVAANVFAVTTAFQQLNRAAQFESMIAGSERLSEVSGKNYIQIAKSLQIATDQTVSFQAALESTNKILSTGADISQIEQLGTLAQKASQVFAGDTQQFLGRFVDSIIRGEVELLKTIGITKTLDRINEDFANSVNKNVAELSAQERQMAVLNAVLEEGGRLFADVTPDSSPFEQLAASMQDLKMDTLSVANAFAGPIAEGIGQSSSSIAALGLLAGKLILGLMVPSLGTMAEGWRNTARAAQDAAAKKMKSITAVQRFNKSAMDKRVKAEIDAGKAIIANAKKVQEVRDGILNKAVKGNLTSREAKEGLRRLQGVQHLDPKAQVSPMRAEYRKFAKEGGAELERMFVRVAKTGNESFQTLGTRAKDTFNSIRANARVMKAEVSAGFSNMAAQAKTGFSSTMSAIASGGVLAGFRNLRAQMAATSVEMTALSAKASLTSRALTMMGVGARVAGAGIAFVGGALTKLLGIATTAFIAFQTINMVLGMMGIEFFKTSEAAEKFNSFLEGSEDRIQSMEGKADNLRKVLEGYDEISFSSVTKEIEFLNGVFDEFQTNIDKVINTNLRGLGGQELVSVGISNFKVFQDQLGRISKDIDEYNEKRKTLMLAETTGDKRGTTVSIRFLDDDQSKKVQETLQNTSELRSEIELLAASMGTTATTFNETVKAIRDNGGAALGEIISSFRGVQKAAEETNSIVGKALAEKFDEQVKNTLAEVGKIVASEEGLGQDLVRVLEAAIKTGNTEAIQKVFDDIAEATGDRAATENFFRIASGFSNMISGIQEDSTKFVSANKSMTDALERLGKAQRETRDEFSGGSVFRENISTLNTLQKAIEVAASKGQINLGKDLELSDEMSDYLQNAIGITAENTTIYMLLRKIKETNERNNRALQITETASLNIAAAEAQRKAIQVSISTSYSDQIEKARALASNQKDILDSEVELLSAKIDMLSSTSRLGNMTEKQLKVEVARIASLKAQRAAILAQRSAISENLAAAKEYQSIQETLIDNENDILSSALNLNKVQAQLTSSFGESQRLTQVQNDLQRRQLELKNKELIIEIGVLQAKEGNEEADRDRIAALVDILKLNGQVIVAQERLNAKLAKEALYREKIILPLEGKIALLQEEQRRMDSITGTLIDNTKGEYQSLSIQSRRLNQEIELNRRQQEELKIQGISNQEEQNRLDLLKQQELSLQAQQALRQQELARAQNRQSSQEEGGVAALWVDPAGLGRRIGYELGFAAREQLTQMTPAIVTASEGILKAFDNTTDKLIQGIYEGDLSLRSVLDTLRQGIAEMLLDVAKEGLANATRSALSGLGESLIGGKDKNTSNGGIMSELLGKSVGQLSTIKELQSSGLAETLVQTGLQATTSTVLQASQLSASTQRGMMISLLGVIAANTGMSAVGSMGSQISSFASSAVSSAMSVLPGLAKGGITNGISIAGEAGPEAVVPLPGNKKIPVQIKSDEGDTINNTTSENNESVNIVVNQNFDFSNADKDSEAKLRAYAEQIKQETIGELMRKIDQGGSYAKRVGRR